MQQSFALTDLLVGDFNKLPGGSVTQLLERYGYIDSAVFAGCPDVPTNIADGRGDYIWIHRKISNFLEYHVMKKQDLACKNRHKEYLSDHLPLWITVGVH